MADFEDEFSGTEGDDLATHTPDVGTGYTHSNTARNAEINAANQLRAIADGALQTIKIDPALGSSDQQAWFRLYSDELDSRNSRVCLNLVDTTAYSVGASVWRNAGDFLFITTRTGSSTTVIDDDYALTAGEWIRIKKSGTAISWYTGGTGAEPANPDQDTNWTLIASTTTTNGQNETDSGFLLFGTSITNVVADPWIDALRYSTIPAAAASTGGLFRRGHIRGVGRGVMRGM